MSDEYQRGLRAGIEQGRREAMGEIERLLSEIGSLDCGDSSCLFATVKSGMRTNGGCRCGERGMGVSRLARFVRGIRAIARGDFAGGGR